jgi:putative Mg2+ transporter-C (MgtC) family protein
VSLEIELVLRLLMAAVLGSIIGFQRERANKPAGLRTLSLISIGAALFTVISMYGFDGGTDISRVAANIVTGVGFIGAGVIFHVGRGDILVGLTTAASVWVVAAIGMAAGAGMYLLSAVVAVITVIILAVPKIQH